MTNEQEKVINITANTENAIKELKKVLPEINNMVKQIESIFKQIDISKFNKQIQKTVISIKKQIQQLNQNTTIKLSINEQEIGKQISQIEKQIQALQQQTGAQAISFTFYAEGNLEQKIEQLYIKIEELKIVIEDVTTKLTEMIEGNSSLDGASMIGNILDIINLIKDILSNKEIMPLFTSISTGIAEAFAKIGPAVENAITALGLGAPEIAAIIAAIIAIVALVILAIMNWDSIMNWLSQTIDTVVNAVVGFFTDLWNNVSFIFEAIWNVISTILGFIWNMFSTAFTAIWAIVSPIINAIWDIISTVFQTIWTIISTVLGSIWNTFSQIFNWIWELVSKVFQGVWNIISPIINKVWETIKMVLEKIKSVWTTIWTTIKNTVTNIWNGIWSVIKKVINSILSGIESFVNGAIKGINFLLSGISKVANAVGSVIGLSPINLQISMISLPRLAKGNVAYSPMIAQFGEYVGASSNPEITAPQSILKDTFDEVLSNHEFSSNRSGSPLQLAVYVGNKKLGDILLDDLREKRRSTGKGLEVIVGG